MERVLISNRNDDLLTADNTDRETCEMHCMLDPQCGLTEFHVGAFTCKTFAASNIHSISYIDSSWEIKEKICSNFSKFEIFLESQRACKKDYFSLFEK